ncbi:hypothetical protein L1887_38202 [Cichorium endivia]|nr:hypothetical protein L1887_38202 [Cichorium endivia]
MKIEGISIHIYKISQKKLYLLTIDNMLNKLKNEMAKDDGDLDLDKIGLQVRGSRVSRVAIDPTKTSQYE